MLTTLTSFSSNDDIGGSYRENSEWKLMPIQKERALKPFSCCPAPFSILNYTVKVRRRASFYVVNIIFPCGVIASLYLISFCLPPDSGERVSLVINILLAMAVYMTVVADQMPPNSEVVPMISVFFMIIFVQIALVLIVTCIITNIQFKIGPLPTLVVNVFNNKLAKLVGLKKQSVKYKASLKQPMKHSHIIGEDNLGVEVIQDLQENGKTNNREVGKMSENTATKKNEDSFDCSDENEDVAKHNNDEWRFLARVLNRVFFVVFFCFALLYFVIILVTIFS